jgi:hypothetical protein
MKYGLLMSRIRPKIDGGVVQEVSKNKANIKASERLDIYLSLIITKIGQA